MYHIPPHSELTCDAITRDFRIWQRRAGHRYSLDDLATAWQAAAEAPTARTVLDLGCGVGSVLLMLAWKLPTAVVRGIEVQPVSLALAERSVAHNELAPRVQLFAGDLREVTARWEHGPCELVTGTPPYLPRGTALESPDPQRAAARIELHGGVEDYVAAGARVLAGDGLLVLCADGRRPERVLDSAAAHGLSARCRRDVWARPNAEHPLFSVWTLARSRGCLRHERLEVRDAQGGQTSAARALRAAFGL